MGPSFFTNDFSVAMQMSATEAVIIFFEIHKKMGKLQLIIPGKYATIRRGEFGCRFCPNKYPLVEKNCMSAQHYVKIVRTGSAVTCGPFASIEDALSFMCCLDGDTFEYAYCELESCKSGSPTVPFLIDSIADLQKNSTCVSA
jgi:hypothetical protein